MSDERERPWVKVWRNTLNRDLVSFLILRYGHDAFTFFFTCYTKCDDRGVVLADEDVLEELAHIKHDRWVELRGIMILRKLMAEDPDGHLVVLDWVNDQERPGSESAERVRRFRERKQAERVTGSNVTPPLQNVTGNEEGRGDIVSPVGETTEGRGETRARAEEPPPPDQSVPEEKDGPAPPPLNPGDEAVRAREVVRDWFDRLPEIIGGVRPSPPADAEAWALQVVRAVGGNMTTARRLRAEYFSSWREFWFAVARGGMDLSEDRRAPDFDFRAYCKHIDKVAARSAIRERNKPRPRPPRAPPTPEDFRAAGQSASAARETLARTSPELAAALAARDRQEAGKKEAVS